MATNMRVGLYSPLIIDHQGGGERYILTIAEHLSINRNCKVDLITQRSLPRSEQINLKKKLTEKFHLNLTKVNCVFGPFTRTYSALDRFKFTRTYNSFLSFTDGSVFFAGSKRNILHIQIPLKKGPSGLLNRLKLSTWQVKVANAYFTKHQVEKNWRVKVNFVHWGAVDSQDFKPGKKKNIILHVGRFFTGLHCKRQDIITDTFKKMVDQGLKNWRLVLIGSIDPGDDNQTYANMIAKAAKNYPIIIEHNASFDQLKNWYGQAKIYWHATGYGLDENRYPEKMEHLGLSTVEAMSAGSVPVVINKGGQPEIVTNDKNGFLWESQNELINQTLMIIKDNNLRERLSQTAQERANDFSKEKFQRMTDKIFNLS